MNVILLEDVVNVGVTGDLVSVKPGYARNYLIPRNMAAVASSQNKKQLEHCLLYTSPSPRDRG